MGRGSPPPRASGSSRAPALDRRGAWVDATSRGLLVSTAVQWRCAEARHGVIRPLRLAVSYRILRSGTEAEPVRTGPQERKERRLHRTHDLFEKARNVTVADPGVWLPLTHTRGSPA